MPKINFDFGDNSLASVAPFDVNRVEDGSLGSTGTIIASMLDDTDSATGISYIVDTVFAVSAGGLSNAEAGAGAFPERTLETNWRTANGGSATFRLAGFSAGQSFTLELIGHLNNTARHTKFTVNGASQDYIVGVPTSPTAPVIFNGVADPSGEITVTVEKADSGEFYGYINGFILEYTAATGLTIDSTDASMQRNTNFQVVCSTPSTTPTTGNTTLSVGGDTLTPSSVTGSDPYTITFPVGDLSKQVDATGYDWTLTVDAETATTGNIPLVIQAGYTKVDLVDPVTTNASLLFGVTGDTPVTTDDLEYMVTSVLDSGVTLSGVAASGVWTVTEAVGGDWVTDITVSRRVVQANGTIGTEAVLTLRAPTAGVPVGDRTNFQTIAAYLTGQGTYSSTSTNEIIVEWLADEGYTDQFNKAFYDYLEAQGFTGTLTDKLGKWRSE